MIVSNSASAEMFVEAADVEAGASVGRDADWADAGATVVREQAVHATVA
jgi:hypothetical protein